MLSNNIAQRLTLTCQIKTGTCEHVGFLQPCYTKHQQNNNKTKKNCNDIFKFPTNIFSSDSHIKILTDFELLSKNLIT